MLCTCKSNISHPHPLAGQLASGKWMHWRAPEPWLLQTTTERATSPWGPRPSVCNRSAKNDHPRKSGENFGGFLSSKLVGGVLDGLHTPALPNHASTLTIQETQPSRCWQNRKSLERTDGYPENSVESQVAVITVRAKASTHVALPQTCTCPSAQAHSHLTTRSTRATRKICNSPVSSHCKHDIPTESIPYQNI